MRSLRTLELRKAPSVSETLDWARTLVLLGVETIDAAGAKDTLHILLEVPEPTSSGPPRSCCRPRRAEAACSTSSPGFVTELRRAGLPVSLTEHLDAAEAVTHIPLEDREALKYALAATLVKSSSHWRAFETAFEVFFAVRTGGAGTEGEGEEGGEEGAENEARAGGPGRACRARAARGREAARARA